MASLRCFDLPPARNSGMARHTRPIPPPRHGQPLPSYSRMRRSSGLESSLSGPRIRPATVADAGALASVHLNTVLVAYSDHERLRFRPSSDLDDLPDHHLQVGRATETPQVVLTTDPRHREWRGGSDCDPHSFVVQGGYHQVAYEDCLTGSKEEVPHGKRGRH